MRVGFILKPDKTEAGALLADLVPWLRDQGHVPVVLTEDRRIDITTLEGAGKKPDARQLAFRQAWLGGR